jgi:O-antigen ligase
MLFVVLAAMIVACAVAAGIAIRRPALLIAFLLSVAGVLRFESDLGDTVGGQSNLSSLWLLVLILCCLIALPRLGIFRTRPTTPEICYLIFLAWCGLESSIADDLAFALRMYLKVLYPLLAMCLARLAIRHAATAAQLLRWITGVAAIAYLPLGGLTTRFAPFITMTAAPFLWPFGAFADYAAMMALVALVCWRLFRRWYYLGLAFLLGVNGLLASIRTGVLATVVGISVFLLLEFRRKGLPLVVGMYFAVALAAVALPGIRDKTFMDLDDAEFSKVALDPGSIDVDRIDSSGRTSVWKTVLDRFFWPSPLTGSGLGATQAWFYHGNYGNLMVEHSEYVRLLADTGIVGLGLYLLIVLSSMRSLWAIYRSASHPMIRHLSLLGLCVFPVYLVCMGFDNVLNYVLPAEQFPFALTGAAIGLHQALNQPSQGFHNGDEWSTTLLAADSGQSDV